MTTVQGILADVGAYILDHPKTSAATFVAMLATWTMGGLALHLRSSDRRQRRSDRRRFGR